MNRTNAKDRKRETRASRRSSNFATRRLVGSKFSLLRYSLEGAQ